LIPDVVSGGYLRSGKEETFPWSKTDRKIWFAIVWGDLSMNGWTSSKASKRELSSRLKQLISEGSKFKLIGIWTGNYYSSLFILDPAIAIKYLDSSTV
jgi:hypothetical protein